MRTKLEIGLAVFGVTALAVSVAILLWRNVSANTLIKQFEEARVSAQQAAPATLPKPLHIPPEPAADAPPKRGFTVLPPDQSDWSEARRRHYEAPAMDTGFPLGIMRIAGIGLEVPVLPGSDTFTLEQGVGWLERTALPGDPGNTAIAGHRDSFFRRLGRVEPGDEIEIVTLERELTYRVTGHSIVEPEDVSVLRPVAGTKALTLITCYPFRYVGNAPQRYIVHAELIE